MSTREERVSLDLVMKNLNKEIRDIKKHTMKGFIEGARIVREDMDKIPPLIPVDTGNLRQSWFTSSVYKGKIPVLYFGFSAEYAMEVHEGYGKHFKRPNAGAGFFVCSIYRNKSKILNAIKVRVRV